jgi:hypothetical protein
MSSRPPTRRPHHSTSSWVYVVADDVVLLDALCHDLLREVHRRSLYLFLVDALLRAAERDEHFRGLLRHEEPLHFINPELIIAVSYSAPTCQRVDIEVHRRRAYVGPK